MWLFEFKKFYKSLQKNKSTSELKTCSPRMSSAGHSSGARSEDESHHGSPAKHRFLLKKTQSILSKNYIFNFFCYIFFRSSYSASSVLLYKQPQNRHSSLTTAAMSSPSNVRSKFEAGRY